MRFYSSRSDLLQPRRTRTTLTQVALVAVACSRVRRGGRARNDATVADIVSGTVAISPRVTFQSK